MTTDRPDDRPCKGTNSNVCVAEGCYGEACTPVTDSPPDPPPAPTRHGLRGRSARGEALCYCGQVFTGPSFKAARDSLNRHASVASRLARITYRRQAP